jgi:hypothetical protein
MTQETFPITKTEQILNDSSSSQHFRAFADARVSLECDLAQIYALPKNELTASKDTCPFSKGTPTMPTMLPLGPLVLLQGRTNTLWTPGRSKLRRSAFIFQQRRNMCVSKSKDHASNWFCSSCALTKMCSARHSATAGGVTMNCFDLVFCPRIRWRVDLAQKLAHTHNQHAK